MQDPYGNNLIVLTASWVATSDSYGWTYDFQGGRYDAPTGLFHFNARDYNAALGTWVQKDPGGYIDGCNQYQFTRDNPVVNSDPSGLCNYCGFAKALNAANQLAKHYAQEANEAYDSAANTVQSVAVAAGATVAIYIATNASTPNSSTAPPRSSPAPGYTVPDEYGVGMWWQYTHSSETPATPATPETPATPATPATPEPPTAPGTPRNPDGTPKEPGQQSRELREAQEAAQRARPSIKKGSKKGDDEWEGARKRPEQNRIRGTRKSDDRDDPNRRCE